MSKVYLRLLKVLFVCKAFFDRKIPLREQCFILLRSLKQIQAYVGKHKDPQEGNIGKDTDPSKGKTGE